MMRPRVRCGRGGGLAVGLAAVSLILAGCVNLPSGGTLRNVNPLLNANVGSQLVITPREPGPQWPPLDIVAGFLVASGANPDDLSIARDYLTPAYAKAWHPEQASPNVIDPNYKAVQTQVPTRVTGAQSSYQVSVTSQHLDSLVPAARANEAGTLQVAPGPGPYKFNFELIQFDGKWRIDSIIGPNGKPSDSILLLTGSDFEREYLPRNLYYLAAGSPQTLVPYPVYIPAQTGQEGAVQKLVDAVGTLPPTKSNWLYQAITTAFSPGAKLTAQVIGSTAVVTLGGAAGSADLATLTAMEAQLAWTLTYSPDSPGGTGITSVELDTGHGIYSNLLWSGFKGWVPQWPSGQLFYQTLDRTGHPLLGTFTPSRNFGSPSTSKTGGVGSYHGLVVGSRGPEPLPAGLGVGRFTAVAVSPPTSFGVSYFAGCRGTKAYVSPALVLTDVESRDLPGNCTSLSWDNQGDCWAIAGSDVYVLNTTPPALQVTPVSVLAQQIAQSDRFVALKVAPDGLRVAMIVRGKNGASVYVSAITKDANNSTIYLAQGGPMLTVGPNLMDPIALAWWDSDHLLVLDSDHGMSQLYEVPLHGGRSNRVLGVPSNAISVASNGSFVAVSTLASASGGHGRPTIEVLHGLEGPWIQVAAGTTATYAG